MRILFGLLLITFLAGCATLSREDCARGDWFGVGVIDGRAGHPVSLFYKHQQACAEYHIDVDKTAYLAGHQQGLEAYCQLDNAFQTGLDGRAYHHLCPPGIDALFARYHEAGFRVHQVRSSLEKVDRELASKEKALLDEELKDKARKRLRRQIKALDRKRERLLDDLSYHEQRFDDLWREAHPSY